MPFHSPPPRFAAARCLLLAACLGTTLVASPGRAADNDALPGVVSADGGRYVGPLVDGKRHGRGRIDWPNGSFYEGEFAAGLYSGQGRLKSASGQDYVGTFADGQMAGHGRLSLIDGAVYVGEFRADELNGQGRLEQPDGTIYEGGFVAGLYHGHGVFTGDGQEYRGEFRQGRFAGDGELRLADGRKYRGRFVRGRFDGPGRFENAGGEIYEGEFRNDEFVSGIYSRPGGARHEGRFVNWRPHGPGRYTDERGDVYEGDFNDGDLNGPGRLIGKRGSRYEGDFKHWRFDGRGKLTLFNGDVYEGGFADGRYDGDGTLTYGRPHEDGRRHLSGTWRYGSLVDSDSEQLAKTNVETALYQQRRLLDAALQGLAPRDPERINLYLLGIAGDGAQEVFRREVEFVRDQFDRRFATGGRSLLLINSRKTVGTAPMATLTSIGEALAAIAARMDRERDILFLFLSSHGSDKHELTLNQNDMRLPDLPAARLAEMLDKTGIRWRVIVVSACYSGGFIDALKNEHTLIITAARHDRQSFGCADDNDFTYFGRAFFKEALPASRSFSAAFASAATLIAEWERRDFKAGEAGSPDEFSEPQIASPAKVEAYLQTWWAQWPEAPTQQAQAVGMSAN